MDTDLRNQRDSRKGGGGGHSAFTNKLLGKPLLKKKDLVINLYKCILTYYRFKSYYGTVG
ncbi:hypothetical protein ACJX0J_036456, partial [Zea mays]